MNINKRRIVNRCTAMKWFPENENYLKLHSPFHLEPVQISKRMGVMWWYLEAPVTNLAVVFCTLWLRKSVQKPITVIYLWKNKLVRRFCASPGRYFVMRPIATYNTTPGHHTNAFPGHIKHFSLLSVEGEKFINISNSNWKWNWIIRAATVFHSFSNCQVSGKMVE